MGVAARFKQYHSESVRTIETLSQNETFCTKFVQLVDLSVKTLESGNRIFTAGNGGSFADALHISGELVNFFTIPHKPYPVMALGSNGAVLSAWANDHDFNSQLSRELTAFAHPGDLLIAITTSGKSQNIRMLVETAKALGVYTSVLTGKFGQKNLPEVNVCLSIDSTVTPHIQEAHVIVYHALCAEIERHLTQGEA